jgi:predicted Zn-dependent protease
MRLRESHRKYILLGLVFFIVVGLIFAKVMAKKQDEQFLTNELLFEQAQQLYAEGDYESATKYINEVLKKQPNSEIVNYTAGLISVLNEDYKKAAILLQKTIEINPHRVEDPIFMLQLGETFYHAERMDDAKIVLKHCQDAGWAPDKMPSYQERVTELLNSIENNK